MAARNYEFSAINPYAPLPQQHSVVRVPKKKQWLLLENDGIMNVALKFSLADLKSLKVNNKLRQLLLGFKVDVRGLRKVLNDYINNNNSTPAGAPHIASVGEVVQHFTGTYNGIKMTVCISNNEFGSQLANTRNGLDNSPNYLKIIIHHFHEKWRILKEAAPPNFSLAQRRNVISEQTNVDGVASFNRNNVLASTGLFVMQWPENLFMPQGENLASSYVGSLDFDQVEEGREEPSLPFKPLGENPKPASTINGFNYLSKLPLSLEVIEKNSFSYSPRANPAVISAARDAEGFIDVTAQDSLIPPKLAEEQKQDFGTTINSAFKAIAGGFGGTSAPSGSEQNQPSQKGGEQNQSSQNSNERVKRDNVSGEPLPKIRTPEVFAVPTLLASEINLPDFPGDEFVEKHEFILQERKTSFYIYQSEAKKKKEENPFLGLRPSEISPETKFPATFVFDFYENHKRYERCWVDPTYLGASLDEKIFQYVRETHSSHIVYTNILFHCYEQKTWRNTQSEEPFCYKVPLKSIGEKSFALNYNITGNNPSEIVNSTANLMFCE